MGCLKAKVSSESWAMCNDVCGHNFELTSLLQVKDLWGFGGKERDELLVLEVVQTVPLSHNFIGDVLLEAPNTRTQCFRKLIGLGAQTGV